MEHLPLTVFFCSIQKAFQRIDTNYFSITQVCVTQVCVTTFLLFFSKLQRLLRV